MSNMKFKVSDKIVPYYIPDPAGYCGVMFVAEAPGETEDQRGEPLIGDAGKKFDSWLEAAKLNRKECILANVFRFRPENNRIDNFFVSAKVAKEQDLHVADHLPKYNGKFLLQHFQPEIDQLHKVVVEQKPKIIVAMGNVACWALLGETKITLIQGKLREKNIRYNLKSYRASILPCFHPAYAIRVQESEKDVIACFNQAFDTMKGNKND